MHSLQLNGVEPPSVQLFPGMARPMSAASSQHEVPQGPQNQLARIAVALVPASWGADGCGREWNLTVEGL